jgi:rubrerythrin
MGDHDPGRCHAPSEFTPRYPQLDAPAEKIVRSDEFAVRRHSNSKTIIKLISTPNSELRTTNCAKFSLDRGKGILVKWDGFGSEREKAFKRKWEQKGAIMDEKKFQEIINFAIDKEIKSFNFYTSASQVAKYSGAKELFSELAQQEVGHRKMLERLDMGKIAQTKIEKVPDLKISDYMVDTEFRPDMPYADILRKAIKMEERALKLYTNMNQSNQDEKLNKLFSFLANEEAKHKLRLEKIYDDEILK